MINPLKYTNRKLTHTNHLILVYVSVLFLVLIGGLPEVTEAASASLYLSPPSGTYDVGGTFSVAIKINSGGEVINAAEGTLIFNPAELNVVSLSKTGSIFTLWTTEPIFSNSTGNIVFGGGVPTNFSGTSGTILTINFKAKANASAQVNFSSSSVLAADGKGTNVLGNMVSGVYTIKPKVTIPPAEQVPAEQYTSPTTSAGTPLAPVISSVTHPDANRWYSNSNPEFTWELPSGITAVRLLIGKIPNATPNILYTSPISEKKLENLEDGVWYFHIQFKNQYGWGAILHRKVLIDTEPPKPFEIKVDYGGDPTNPTPILYFDTIDSLSGVEYYELKVGEKEPFPIASAYLRENPYKMPVQGPGKRTILVEAVDAAKNSTVNTADLEIKPLETPVITDFPETVQVGETLIIRGTSKYPDATVTIFVKKEGEEASKNDVKADNQGNWSFVYNKSLEKGTYQAWAEVTDSRGAKSNPTDKITIAASLSALLRIGGVAINYLTVLLTLIILIAALIGVIFYTRYRISGWQKRIKKETKEAKKSVAKAFHALRQEVQEQIEYFDKKPGLTEEEKEIRDKLHEALNVSEGFVSKEIKDIEKELR